MMSGKCFWTIDWRNFNKLNKKKERRNIDFKNDLHCEIHPRNNVSETCYIFIVLISFYFSFATVCCLLHHIHHHHHRHRYNIVFLIVTYGVPMFVMVVCYTIMGKVLWGSQSIGEHTQRQIESIKAKKKVCHLLYQLIYLFTSRWSFKLFQTRCVCVRVRRRHATTIHHWITSSLIFRFYFSFFYLFIWLRRPWNIKCITKKETKSLHRIFPLNDFNDIWWR